MPDGQETVYTSQKLRKIEQSLVQTAIRWSTWARGGCDPDFLTDVTTRRAAARAASGREAKPLDDITTACESLLKPGRLKILIGPPGAGKTSVINIIGETLALAGQSAVLTAQSGMLCQKLAEETRQTTLPVGDLMARLSGPEQAENKQKIGLTSGSTIILDEAAMLGTRQMFDIFKLAKDHDLNLILIGDTRQIEAATAGSPLRKTLEFIEPARLTGITRQKTPQDAQATLDLYHGNPEAALLSYQSRDMLTFHRDAEKLRDQVVDDFVAWQKKHQASDDPEYNDNEKKAVVLTISRKEAKKTNMAIRKKMQKSDLIGDSTTIDTHEGEMDLACGEPVIFRQRLEARNQQGALQTIYKGSRAEIVAIDSKNLHVTLDGHPEILAVARDPDVRMSYGYATELSHRDPADSPQGSSMTRVFTMIEGPITPGQALVGLSRHKKKMTLYVNAKTYPDLPALADACREQPAKAMVMDYDKSWTPAPGIRPGTRQ